MLRGGHVQKKPHHAMRIGGTADGSRAQPQIQANTTPAMDAMSYFEV
jgi:hypothetical protein